jgi:hypothetical protein
MPADRGWSRRFDEPIVLPNGKKLLTLKDAFAWLHKERSIFPLNCKINIL